MPTDITTTLRKALTELENDRRRIDQQVAAIKSALTVFSGRPPQDGRRAAKPRKAAKWSMSAAARRAASQRMRAYWAKRGAEAKKQKR